MTRNLHREEAEERQAPEFSEQYLLDRLVAAGIGCLDDWRALSPRARRNIFGITAGMAQAIDRLAKARQPGIPVPSGFRQSGAHSEPDPSN